MKRRYRSSCPVCGQRTANVVKKCNQCRRAVNANSTYQELIDRLGKFRARVEVQRGARKACRGLNSCAVCGYTAFVEACHIMPVAGFDLNTKIYSINAPSNLVGLCPNHHWELDHGLLDSLYADKALPC